MRVMIQYANIIALQVLSLLQGCTSDGKAFREAQHTSSSQSSLSSHSGTLEKHGKARSGQRSNNRMRKQTGFRALMQARTKQEIMAFYQKLPVTHVTENEFTIGGKPLLCVTADTGSGGYILTALIYVFKDAEWLLAYQKFAGHGIVTLKFAAKGDSGVDILGAAMIVKGGVPSLGIYNKIASLSISHLNKEAVRMHSK